MTLDTSSARTVASTLAHDIRADIISGELAPGTRLRIKDLCLRYDSGAIPLREALSRLATSGFVVAEDQRGFRVADISSEELIDITDTRVHIECEALRRSIASGGLDWEERVAGTHYRLNRLVMRTPDGQGLSPEWEQAHAAFHAALISGSGSRWLITLAGILRDQTARYRHLSIGWTPDGAHSHDQARDVTVEHDMLKDAALARDAKQAEHLLSEHLQETSRWVLAQYGKR